MMRYVLILLVVFTTLPAAAQSYIARIDRYQSDSIGSGVNSSLTIKWIGAGQQRYAWYDCEELGLRVYRMLDLRTGRQTPLFDNERMAALLTPHADTSQMPSAKRLGLSQLNFDKKNPFRFTFDYNKKRLQYDIRTEKLTELQKQENHTPRNEHWERDYSADSLYYTTVVEHNMILAGRGDSLRLTSDGEPYYSFASGGAAKKKGSGGSTGVWIGKSHKYLVVREDERKVGVMSIVNSLAKRPEAKTYKYVATGDKEVTQYELHLVDAARRKIVRLDTERFPDQKIEIPRFHPFPVTTRSAYFIRRSRTCDSMELCRVDAADDSLRPIICETTPKHLNEQLFGYHVINDGREILWWSERSGRGQFLLYDGDGKLKNAVTDGRFVAGKIVRIDTLGRSAIVEGYGGEKGINPHYRLFYKVSLDGGKAVCLTPENGHHSLDLAPGGKYLYDRWSRMDMPEQRRIADMSGKTVAELPAWDLSEPRAKGWREPKLLELLAADSVTKLYGVVYLPFDMDPAHKYPIISNVYPGPQDDQVPLAFSIDDNDNMTLAQLGFIVVNFSHRGACPTRGRDYYNYGYGNLRDYAIDDDMAVIRQVAERYPAADLERVGIYGHSGGGFMTAAAMFMHPEFYKVGVSASGNHDNNIYAQWWGEVYHGVTQTVDKQGQIGFESRVPTTIELADRLQGRLMLVHGDMDDNVHPASTIRLANALIKAGKRFDMMIIPGADHGLPIGYFTNLVRYYFVENLLGRPQTDTNILKHN